MIECCLAALVGALCPVQALFGGLSMFAVILGDAQF